MVTDNVTINVSDTNKRSVEQTERVITRSGREVKRPQRYGDYVAYQVNTDSSIYQPTVEYVNPISMAAMSDPDTIYYHETLHQPDKQNFIEAMAREIDDHNEKGHWRLIRRSKLPSVTRVLPSVCAMRPKRELSTGEVIKFKARLNVDGSKQQAGIDYDQTYAPVASWLSVRLSY
jgi:hypothetical protein